MYSLTSGQFNKILLNGPLDKEYFVSETLWICFENFSC